jgi:hypothetical protein
MTAMIVLAIAKYYLHDTKQAQQTKPTAQIEEIRNQLDEIQQKQQAQKKKQLDDLGL